MKKSEAQKSIELVVEALEPHVEGDTCRRILETVLREYFTPQPRKSSKAAFKERVIKTLLQPYRRKRPLIPETGRIDLNTLLYTYYIKSGKLYLTDKKTVFTFVGQEQETLEDGYYSRKGELLKALSEGPDDIWEERLISVVEELEEGATFYLDSAQVKGLANQFVGEGEEHSFSVTREGVKKDYGLQSDVFKLMQQVLKEPEVEVSVRLNSNPLIAIKSKEVNIVATLINRNRTDS